MSGSSLGLRRLFVGMSMEDLEKDDGFTKSKLAAKLIHEATCVSTGSYGLFEVCLSVGQLPPVTDFKYPHAAYPCSPNPV